jgi:MFS family permease
VSVTFSSLASYNYRVYAAGSMVSNIGTWMQRVAQDWLVLTVLTDDSAVAVGITTALQFVPMVALAPVTGLLCDRLPQRSVLIVTKATSGLWALILGLLVVTGTAELWHVYVLATLLGVSTAFDAPARQTFVGALVEHRQLPNAVGLNSTTFHLARLIGPALAGFLIAAFGTGPVFLINAGTFFVMLIALYGLRADELHPMAKAVRSKGQIREGMRYVRDRPDIMLILVVMAVVGTFGMNFQLSTALMARLEFDLGAGGYGVLGSFLAVGSLGGALLAARRRSPGIPVIIAAAAASGTCAIIASLMPTYELFALSLIPVGFAALTMTATANATVQMMTASEMRGRVMSLYMAIFQGGTPLGAPLLGWIGGTFGARWTIAVGGVATLAVATAVLALSIRAGYVRLSCRRTKGLRLRVTVTSGENRAGDRAVAPVPADDGRTPPDRAVGD